jgi:hypothetical protein
MTLGTTDQPRATDGRFAEKAGSAPESVLDGTDFVPAESLLESAPEALVDDYGNATFVTGEIYRSNVITGMLAVEVPFGTLYIREDEDIRVRY